MIKFNNNLKLILSDVDETVADLYVEASEETIKELTNLLIENKVIFFITGQSVKSVMWRIIDKIPMYLHKKILIGHCNGAEVYGFMDDGGLITKPYYSVYESNLNELQKLKFREIIKSIIDEFHLKLYPPMAVSQFRNEADKSPLSVMYEDRGPQITFEFVNGYDLDKSNLEKFEFDIPQTHGVYDIRIPILEKAHLLFKKANLPVTPRLGGVFALDFTVEGVNKTTAVKYILDSFEILDKLDLNSNELENPNIIEIWGDKFSEIRGGSDRHMSEAVNPKVRSIDFRIENPDEFPYGYNIVVWDGEKHLHEGLLEYLQNRDK